MLKNKKSLVMRALVVTIIAVVVFFLLVLPACNRVGDAFFSYDTKSFESFVGEINNMPTERMDEFILNLNDESAVIGFGKNTDAFKCYECVEGIKESIVPKPDNQECKETACVCLCDKDFEANGPGMTGNRWQGKCNKPFICKKLDQNLDIADKTVIGKSGGSLTGSDMYWSKSFMFTRNIPQQLNGLEENSDETIGLYVEKKASLITVCNNEILDFNKGTCTEVK